jgi:hypothetical protein
LGSDYSIAIVGASGVSGASDFTFGSTGDVGPSGGILNPGGQCTITVAFHGVVDRDANLVISHDALGSPTLIELQAIVGTGPGQ